MPTVKVLCPQSSIYLKWHNNYKRFSVTVYTKFINRPKINKFILINITINESIYKTDNEFISKILEHNVTEVLNNKKVSLIAYK